MIPKWGEFWTVVLGAIQLAAAIWSYFLINDWITPLFTLLPVLGNLVATIAGAALTLGVSALLIPVSRVEISASDYLTRASIAGPLIELPTRENTVNAVRLDLDVRYTALGYVGKRIALGAMKRGLSLQIDFGSGLLAAHVKNGSGHDTDDGIAVNLTGALPTSGTWHWTSVSFDTAGLPGEGHAEVAHRLCVASNSKLRSFIYRLLLPTSCTIHSIHVVRTT